MRQSLPAFALCSALVALAVLAPVGSPAGISDQDMLGMYFTDPVTFEKPTGSDSKFKSVCGGQCLPGVRGRATFDASVDNGVDTTDGYNLVNSVQATFWLNASHPVEIPIASIEVEIDAVRTFTADYGTPTFLLPPYPLFDPDGGSVPDGVLQIGETPTKVSLAFPIGDPIAIAATRTIQLEIALQSVAAGGSPLPDIFIHYGSAEYPSGVVVEISKSAGANRLGGGALDVNLATDDLLFGELEGAEGTRSISGSFPSMGSETWWANASAPASFTFLNDAALLLTMKASAAPEVFWALTAYIYIGDQPYNGTTYLDSNVVQSGTTAFPVGIGVPLENVSVSAGDRIGLSFQLMAMGEPTTPASFEIVFGTTDSPSGFIAAVDAGGSGPTSEPTDSTSTGATTSSSQTTTTHSTSSTQSTNSTQTSSTNDDNGSAKDLRSVRNVGHPANLPAPAFLIGIMGLVGAILVARRKD